MFRGGPITIERGGPHNISTCLFEGNSAGAGGGLSVMMGTYWPVYISDTIFKNNFAALEGGGIYFARGRDTAKPSLKSQWYPLNKLILKNVLFESNTAKDASTGNTGAGSGFFGGGLAVVDMFNYGTTLQIDRETRFVDNKAINEKGLIVNKDAVIVNLDSFHFLDCQPGYFTLPNIGNIAVDFNSDRSGCRFKCPPGSYGQGIATRINKESCKACPIGHFCADSGTANPTICPLGSYCKPSSEGEGIFYARPCPPGTYGNTAGLTSNACSGVCPIGHYW